MTTRANKQAEQRACVLVLVLLLLLLLTLIGINAVNTTNYELRISGNNRISKEAFYVAEAGIDEFKGRFREGTVGATGESIEIVDSKPENADWKLFLVANTGRAVALGYESGTSSHILVHCCPR